LVEEPDMIMQESFPREETPTSDIERNGVVDVRHNTHQQYPTSDTDHEQNGLGDVRPNKQQQVPAIQQDHEDHVDCACELQDTLMSELDIGAVHLQGLVPELEAFNILLPTVVDHSDFETVVEAYVDEQGLVTKAVKTPEKPTSGKFIIFHKSAFAA
jgi:hypothetical protein